MRNTLLLLIGLFFFGLYAEAQFKENPVLNIENKDKKILNYGYFLGFNQYDFKFDYRNNTGRDILVDKTVGFNVGLIGEMRISEFFDLRIEPGLHYNARTLFFPGFTGDDATDVNIKREVKSTYINFPLLLKINTKRFGNFKPFLLAGPSVSLNLGSNESNKDDNSSGTFRMKKWNYNYELGFGIDFYLEYFKFTPSIRGVFTINDEIIPDADPNSPWTGNIEAFRTRGLFINFTFE